MRIFPRSSAFYVLSDVILLRLVCFFVISAKQAHSLLVLGQLVLARIAKLENTVLGQVRALVRVVCLENSQANMLQVKNVKIVCGENIQRPMLQVHVLTVQ